MSAANVAWLILGYVVGRDLGRIAWLVWDARRLRKIPW